jgi:hypothetical protein
VAGLSLVCVLVTVTAHERGLAIFVMAGSLYLYYHVQSFLGRRREKATGRLWWDRMTTALLALCFLIFVCYWRLIFAPRKPWAGEYYRTVFQADFFERNLLRALEMPMRFFFHPMGRHYDAHLNIWFNAFAVPLGLALICYVITVFGKGVVKERHQLAVVTLLFLCALPLPIFFGGNTWHFFTASMYVSFLMGHALYQIVQKAIVSPPLQRWVLGGLFIWITAGMMLSLNQELSKQVIYAQYLAVVPEALRDPVLRQQASPEVVFFDISRSHRDGDWQFGTGNLFKYVYANPNIVEIPLIEGEVLADRAERCKEIEGKRASFLGFDPETVSWHTIEPKDYCHRYRRSQSDS